MQSELTAGLLSRQAQISPKYFYDVLGSKIFEAICELDEYYLTRCEASIFETFSAEIAARAGHGATLIDLGAGNCEKALRLFPVLQPRQLCAHRHLCGIFDRRRQRPAGEASGFADPAAWHGFLRTPGPAPVGAPGSPAILLSRLLARQFHALAGVAIPAPHPPCLPQGRTPRC